MFADAFLHAEAWYCLEALRRLNRKAIAFGREDDRLGDGMLRLRLDGRHQGQHLPAIEAFGHDEIGQLRRSEEHTSELQSLMRISYAVFCLKKKKKPPHTTFHLLPSTLQKHHQHHKTYSYNLYNSRHHISRPRT